MKWIATTILVLFSKILIAQTDYLNLPFTAGTPYKTYNGNAAVIAAFGSLVIDGFRFENFTNNQNGHALFLQNCTGVTVRNCYFSGTSITNPDVSGNRGLVMQFGGGNTIEDNFFNNCRGGIYVLSSSTGNNIVQDNQLLNITGPYSAGQFIAFNHNTGSGNIIRRNYGANYYGESYAEDMISINLSSGTSGSRLLCEDNIFLGTGPSASGGGIVCGEGGGDYVTIQDNKILEPGNYAFAISVFNSATNPGSFNSLLNNQSYQSSKPWDNNGLIVWGQSGVAADCNVQGNRVTAPDIDFFDNYTICSGCAVNAPTTITLAELAFPDIDDLITFITLDEIYQLRASKLYMEHIITFAASQDGLARRRIERPTANAPANQSISTSTTSLVGTGTPLPAGLNTISGYLWSFVSGPATPSIVSPTSATTNITGMSVSGTYRFRFQVSQNNYADLAPSDNVITQHFGWTEVTVTSSTPIRYKGRIF